MSHYGLSHFINQSNSNLFSITENLFTMAPEILKNDKEIINEKCDIWSLGILIYYMLFKEYPFNGKGEYQILKEIESNKKLKVSDDEKLNDLLGKMLKSDNSLFLIDEIETEKSYYLFYFHLIIYLIQNLIF